MNALQTPCSPKTCEKYRLLEPCLVPCENKMIYLGAKKAQRDFLEADSNLFRSHMSNQKYRRSHYK
jgi:hypothetical protein